MCRLSRTCQRSRLPLLVAAMLAPASPLPAQTVPPPVPPPAATVPTTPTAALPASAPATSPPRTVTLTPRHGPAAPARVTPPATESLAPPLSIRESSLMLRRAIVALERPGRPGPEEIAQLDRMIRAVRLYVDHVDRANPTLPDYRWREVVSQKVLDPQWRTYVFDLAQPIGDVSALSLQARHGDIEVGMVAAVGADKTEWTFNQAIRVRGDEPRGEICQMPLPVRLSSVRITCRQVDDDAHLPRLYVRAGVSPRPEPAREAGYFLQLARDSLKGEDPRAAAAHLRQAFELLQQYQRMNRF